MILPTTLPGLQRFLGLVASQQTLHDIHNHTGKVLVQEVNRGFAAERAPDGRPWIRSASAARRGGKTLHDTGALQNGITWQADSRGVSLKTTGKSNAYAAIHQYGGSRTNHHGPSGKFRSNRAAAKSPSTTNSVTHGMPARPFLPEGRLPSSYTKAINGELFRYMRQRFGFS